MPKSPRRVEESPESRALDDARRAYDRTEALLKRQLDDLKAKAVAAVLADKLTISEAARRAGYTREYLSKLVKTHRQTDAGTASQSASVTVVDPAD